MTEPLTPRQRRRTMTDKMVAALPRKRRRYTVTDHEQRGLYIRVPPTGPSTFAVVARDPYGKQVWCTLGGADVLSDATRQSSPIMTSVVSSAVIVTARHPSARGTSTITFFAHWCGRIVRSHAELCEGRTLTTCSMGIPADRTARFNDWLPETTMAAFAFFQTGRSALLSPA